MLKFSDTALQILLDKKNADVKKAFIRNSFATLKRRNFRSKIAKIFGPKRRNLLMEIINYINSLISDFHLFLYPMEKMSCKYFKWP